MQKKIKKKHTNRRNRWIKFGASLPVVYKPFQTTKMATTVKRIRFGLVFEGVRPPMEVFLREVGMVEAEGIQKDGQHFIVFTVCKPRRVLDVQNAVDAYNRRSSDAIRLVPFCDATVTTFERGNKFMSHPICQAIAQKDETYWTWSLVMAEQQKQTVADQQMINDLEASLDPAAPEDEASVPESSPSDPVAEASPSEAPSAEQAEAPPFAGAPSQEKNSSEVPPSAGAQAKGRKQKKRAISELEMNLVQSVVVPSSAKRPKKVEAGKENSPQVWNSCYGLLCIGMILIWRAFFKNNLIRGCVQTGKKPMSSKKSTKKRSSNAPLKTKAIVKMNSSSSRQFSCVDVMMLVAEMTKSKNETIEAKEKVIRVLESSRPFCAACGVN